MKAPSNRTVRCKHCGENVVTSDDDVDKITICLRCNKQSVIKPKKKGK